jgi:DNA (cytosine-5)-methyltransferase 1
MGTWAGGAEDVPLFDSLPPPRLARAERAMVSLFAGIGGFDLAFQRAGFTPVLHAEADPDPRAVLDAHFPGIPDAGDVCLLKGEPDAVHVLCAGSPCQDFSVAGLRAGLAGQRSGLAWQFVRLVQEYWPTWVVWENVPGVLSSNGGRDFAAIVGALVERGYGCAWRVLDAQCLGVPQRRRRVFLVGHRGDVCRAGQVLFERDGGQGDPAPGSQAGQEFARLVEDGAGGGGLTAGVSPIHTLVARQGGPDSIDAHNRHLLAEWHVEAIGGDVAHTLTCEGHDGTEDGTGRGTPVVALAMRGRAEGNVPEIHADGSIASALRAASGGSTRDLLLTGAKVRRLTPMECERLQGFPDGWTAVRGLSDAARYRMIGNAVAVPVVQWVADGIAAVDAEMAVATRVSRP